MKVVRKSFEKDLYDKYDNPAKEALVKLLTGKGHDIVSTSENYYADVDSKYRGVLFHNEAEVKASWDSEEWPSSWAEIRIPERKRRLLRKYAGFVTFYIFNKALTKCWKIDGRKLKSSMIREAVGPNIRKGEHFYHYPYEEAELINL